MSANTQKTDPGTSAKKAEPSDLGLPMAVGPVAFQAWMEMGAEAVRFVWDRLQQDIETQQAMMSCRSLEEIQKIQAAFFASAQAQYAAEARKMMALMSQAATTGLKAPSTARRHDDVPL